MLTFFVTSKAVCGDTSETLHKVLGARDLADARRLAEAGAQRANDSVPSVKGTIENVELYGVEVAQACAYLSRGRTCDGHKEYAT